MPTKLPLAIVIIVATISAATSYPMLNERNYYADEVTITTHNLTFNSTGGNMSTKWGTLLSDHVKLIITESMLSPSYTKSSDTSRILYILSDSGELSALPTTKNSRFSLQDAMAFANYISTTMTYNFEGRPFVVASGECLSITASDVYTPVHNAIWLYHWKYPYIHVKESADKLMWCFEAG